MDLYDLKTLHLKTPIIDKKPYFSWKISDEKQAVRQTAYQIVVKDSKRCIWDSGVVFSDIQNFVEYEGKPFKSCEKYDWTVTVWTNKEDSISGSSFFETAFLYENDWKAKWIEYPLTRENKSEYPYGKTYSPIRFNKKFETSVDKKIESAKVYASAYGVYKLYLNGITPDNREFAPEFTPYDRIMYYQVYDVSSQIKQGENILSMYVGDGWYFSSQARPVTDTHNSEPSVIFQVEIEYSDGTTETVISDGSETCFTDYVVYSDLYLGEKQDLTLGKSTEQSVVVRDYGYNNLRCQPMEIVRPIELIPAKDVIRSERGELIVDFGQVISGRARINIDAPKGTEIVFEYFEILDKDGNYINTMFAPQKDTVISDGELFVHEALFTFHGFRYIRVTGKSDFKKSDFTAVLLSTEKENVGEFSCSDERINRLYKNVRYSQFNNMMSVPTDCPTREKAGYTGDILVYAKTALLNEDVTSFLTSWLSYVRADQSDDGVVMIVSPFMELYRNLVLDVSKKYGANKITGIAGWSDAIVWVPYDMYKITGNEVILKENYSSMKKWCDSIINTAKTHRGDMSFSEKNDMYIWNTGFHFGEWLVPSRPDNTGEQYGICKESAFYTAPFFGYMSIEKMSEVAEILGVVDDAEYYKSISKKMKNAIIEEIIEKDRLPKYLMGAYVLAFKAGLVPMHLADEYKSRLVNLILKNDKCLDTGFLATPFLLDVLCELHEEALACEIFMQNKRPSWLYEVDNGATTIWEAWDADDARSTGRYVSFDHYAFGCVDEWIFGTVCGIKADKPGFKHFTINPLVIDKLGITSFMRTFESEYGKIKVAYDKDTLKVSVPPNTSATVVWNGKKNEIGSGEYEFI